jgi:hypothetical protein
LNASSSGRTASSFSFYGSLKYVLLKNKKIALIKQAS